MYLENTHVISWKLWKRKRNKTVRLSTAAIKGRANQTKDQRLNNHWSILDCTRRDRHDVTKNGVLIKSGTLNGLWQLTHTDWMDSQKYLKIVLPLPDYSTTRYGDNRVERHFPLCNICKEVLQMVGHFEPIKLCRHFHHLLTLCFLTPGIYLPHIVLSMSTMHSIGIFPRLLAAYVTHSQIILVIIMYVCMYVFSGLLPM